MSEGSTQSHWTWGIPPSVGLAAWFALGSVTQDQRIVGCIFAVTVSLWMLELLPYAMTALLSTAALVLVGGIEEKKAFAAYGDPTIPLFIGSFMLAKSMEVSKLSDRVAWLILGQRWATKSSSMLLLAMGLLTCGISLLVSNTATTAMFLPIGLSMLAAIKRPEGSRFPVAMMLMLTWGSSVAVGVPVGTPPNLIALGMIESEANVKISFVQWMTFGMPITIAMIFASWAVLQLRYGRPVLATGEARSIAADRLQGMGKLTPAERNTIIAFSVAMALWIIPDLSSAVLGSTHPVAKLLVSRIPASTAALVGAALLFVLPAPSEQRFGWRKASSIDWGTIMLFGGGIALGQAMFSTGLAKTLGESAALASGAHTLWAITALCTAAAILLSELASNTAAATTLVPVAIGLADGAGVSPIAPALGVALGASLGFMLPVSTAPNAIVYSSGLVPSKEMLRAGILIDVVGFVVTMLGLWLVLPMMGLV